MHNAQALIDSYASAGSFLSRPLTSREASRLEQALKLDGANYLYSACISIGDAIIGIDRALYTWSTVKLYYATFYLLRSLLALSGRALIYNGTKPKILLSRVGEAPQAIAARGTHQAVIAYFIRTFPQSSLLSQDIANEAPLQWLMHQREKANYGTGRFIEPVCPDILQAVIVQGVRKSVSAYIEDRTFLYAFDPAHAILALPIEALRQTVQSPSLTIGLTADPDARRLLKTLFSDKAGPMRDVLALLNVK